MLDPCSSRKLFPISCVAYVMDYFFRFQNCFNGIFFFHRFSTGAAWVRCSTASTWPAWTPASSSRPRTRPQSAGITTSVADPGSDAFLTPGSGMGKKSGSGSGMNNSDHISKSGRNQFFGLKYLNSLMRIRDRGWKKIGSWIEDKHPGSATLTALLCTLFSKKYFVA